MGLFRNTRRRLFAAVQMWQGSEHEPCSQGPHLLGPKKSVEFMNPMMQMQGRTAKKGG
jgi:hypothetical protein